MDYMPQFGQNVDQQSLPQDDTLMQLDLKRKLALADALRTQEAPQGQMVSGHYVAPSWTQYLNNAVGQYQGAKQEKEALGQFGEYQKGKQAKMAEALGQYQKDLMPRIEQAPQQPATVISSTGEMAPNMGMVNAPARQIPVTGNDRYAALLKLSAATNNPELMQRAIVGGLDYANKTDETASERAYREKQTANDQEFQRVQMKERQGFELTQGEKNFANQMALQKSSQGFQAGQNALSRQNSLKNEPLVAVVGKDGQPTYVPRNQAVGQAPYNPNQAKMTEMQSNANLFGTRAAESNRILQRLEGKYSPLGIQFQESMVGGLPGVSYVANKAMSPETQQAAQAQRDFVTAVLRKESGAAISASEFDNARKQYFDQPGDSLQVKAQKAQNRQTAIQGIQAAAGPLANQPQVRVVDF